MANDTCGYPPNINDFFWYLSFVAYNIAAPVYFVLAVSGHGLLLFAFIKQLKTQELYMYQVYCASIRTTEALLRSIYYVAMLTLAAQSFHFHSFQDILVRSYPMVWYANHLSTPLPTSCTTWALLLLVAMAADRAYALLKPMAYKGLPHARIRRIVLLVSALMSFGVSAFDIFRGYVIPNGAGGFTAVLDVEYVSRPYVKALAMLRVSIQATALIALTALSVALCYLYRTRFVNTKVKIVSTAEQKKAKEEERTLLLLTFIEGSLTVVSMSVAMGNYIIVYGLPSYVSNCWHSIVTPVHDMSRMVIDVSNFYVILMMSGKTRRMVKAAVGGCLPKMNEIPSIQVAPAPQVPDVVVQAE